MSKALVIFLGALMLCVAGCSKPQAKTAEDLGRMVFAALVKQEYKGIQHLQFGEADLDVIGSDERDRVAEKLGETKTEQAEAFEKLLETGKTYGVDWATAQFESIEVKHRERKMVNTASVLVTFTQNGEQRRFEIKGAIEAKRGWVLVKKMRWR